jgi:uncharacterized membrane protein
VRTVGLRWLGLLGVAAALFVVLDLVWLTVVATSLYDRLLGDLLADEPNTAAAVGFYVLFLLGLTHFVIRPAVDRDSLALAARDGAFFGLATYATWDLTNLAVIEAFPAAAVSGGTVAVWRALTRRRARAGR